MDNFSAPQRRSSMQTKSLYERLGGYDAIAAVTDDLLARLLNDPQLGVFWKGHSENSLRRDRQLVVNYMCEAAGGSVFYTGRDMQTSHKGLGISASDWAVFMRHATAALEKFAVPAPEREEVLAFLSSLQGDVVERA
jgi:hemoglobin